MRSKFLKLLAVVAFGLITFPFVLTNDVVSFENISPLRMLGYYGGFTVLFLIGYAFAYVAYRRKVLTVIMRLTGVFSFASGLIMLLWTKDTNIIFALCASSVLWYFLGVRASRKHYADIFPVYMFGLYIVVTLISYIVYGMVCEKELKEPVQTAVIVVFMVEMCLVALLINQSEIYDKANRRRETRTMLPKELSAFNALLVLGVTGTGLVLYVFADEIVFLLKKIAGFFIKAFLFLMRGHSEFIPVDGGDEYLEGNGYTTPETNDFWNVIFFIILIAVVICFRKQILEVIKNIIKSIISFFMRETEKSMPEPEFVDIFEDIGYDRKKAKGVSYSALMRQYRSEKNAIKKYRIGYGILLKQLLFCKIDIKRADTVTVQHEKGREICGETLKEVTECYNSLRYDDASVSEADLSALDRLIADMGVHLKGRI